MADHVTLAHDNTKSGSWEPAKNTAYDAHLERFRKAAEDFEHAIASGDMDRARDLAEMMDSVYGYHAYNAALDDGYMDISESSDHTPSMNDITREELNAKLETIESKMDARVESVSAKIDGFLAAQSERDKRYELLAERVTKAAEGAEEAAKQAATVKSNYWAAVIVQLLAVVAILVGGYFANQANVLGAMQTTMAAMQAGRDQSPPPSSPPSVQQKN